MTIANFARFGKARAWDLKASSQSIVICSARGLTPDVYVTLLYSSAALRGLLQT
jgi:hypothetical protein